MPYTLSPLPYAYDALEPYIDMQTATIHHDKHQASYVANLNAAIQGQPMDGMPEEELLKKLDQIPDSIRAAVRNNAGGDLNHNLYWHLMTPGGPKGPVGLLAEAITQSFGSFETFQKSFNDAGMKRLGSGWVWLFKNKNGDLEVANTPYHDNPITDGGQPVLVNDVWEHAYYLKYQNRRAEYLEAWWNLVNWEKAAEIFAKLK